MLWNPVPYFFCAVYARKYHVVSGFVALSTFLQQDDLRLTVFNFIVLYSKDNPLLSLLPIEWLMTLEKEAQTHSSSNENTGVEPTAASNKYVGSYFHFSELI